MGASIQPRRSRGRSSMAEINVTPLVDVMLVLLIVFMVSAPLMQQGIEVDLPKTKANGISEAPAPVILTIAQDRRIKLGDTWVSLGQLKVSAKQMGLAANKSQVLVQADHRVPYGFVAEIMSLLQQAQIKQVGLVTVPVDGR